MPDSWLAHQSQHREHTRDKRTAGNVTPNPDAHTHSFPGFSAAGAGSPEHRQKLSSQHAGALCHVAIINTNNHLFNISNINHKCYLEVVCYSR